MAERILEDDGAGSYLAEALSMSSDGPSIDKHLLFTSVDSTRDLQ